ncbi:hypothetical protein [Tenacibaculum xiamenense]|uniref:hypothetical protein n=1 Tax=Tenacibaculum xiamenense TaxID=1261553 RepID=UPI00389331BC
MSTITKPVKTTTQTITSKLSPVEWNFEPNTVLYGTVLRTTDKQFGATIKIENHKGDLIESFSLKSSSGFESNFIGSVDITDASDFPLIIKSTITCSTDFECVNAPQTHLGLKLNKKGTPVPVCYQSTLFCNDSLNDTKKDMDYNDFVITWQLYDSSHDS